MSDVRDWMTGGNSELDPGQLILVNARIVHELSDAGPDDGAVLVRGDSIVMIGDPDLIVDEARQSGAAGLIDLDGAFILPGLIDMHTHFGVVHPGTTDEVRLAGETEAGLALRMAACARSTLEAGVTTVRLVSEKGGSDQALRSAVEAGQVRGPRIFSAGRAIAATGGHGLGSHAVEADGPADFRRQTRDQIKGGADLVKLMISGGVSDEVEGLNRLEMAEDELRAAVAVAHAWGKPVAGHLGGSDVIDLALDCGVDSVEHGYVLTEAVCHKMAAGSVWLVPTMMVTRGAEYFHRIEAPNWLIDRLDAAAARHDESVAMAAAKGVRILAGTDFVPSEPFHDATAMVCELEALTGAGLEPIEALRAATTSAAESLGATGTLGTVSVGARADLIAVGGDPRSDIGHLRDMRLVVGRGHIASRRRSLQIERIPVLGPE